MDIFPIPEQVLDFRRDIRQYNNAFAMRSLWKTFAGRGPFISIYNSRVTIEGFIYHYISEIEPVEGRSPHFASLYFHDTNLANSSRNDFNLALDESILSDLVCMLEDIVKSFVLLQYLINSGSILKKLDLVLHLELNYILFL